MAFAYDGRGLPHLDKYQDALTFWQQAGKWRDEENERVLDDRRKKYVNIRQTRDGSIACRLHNTDVVTYHPDNTLTLVSWASVSTDEFAGRLLGWTNVDTYFNQGFIKVGDKFYQASNTIELAYNPDTEGYAVTNTPEPFRISTVNRKEANAVLKEYDYKAFADWVRMVAASGMVFDRRIYGRPRATVLLPDRQRWEELVEFESHWNSDLRVLVAPTLESVRKSLYQDNPQVYDVVTMPYLTEWAEVERWKRSRY